MRTAWLVALCLTLLAAGASAQAQAQPACPPQPANTITTTPDVRRGHDVRFRNRLAAIEQALTSQRYDVILLGDSIVQQWPQASAEQAFPGQRVLNAGVVGDGAAQLLHRLQSRRTEATVGDRRVQIGVSGWERQSPRQVAILIGTNDLRRGTPCDVVAGILAVVRQVHALYPQARIQVVSILPRGAAQDELVAEIAEINGHLAQAAPTAGFDFVDANAALRCAPGSACAITRPPGHVHLTEEGYTLLSETIRRQERRPSR